MGVIITFDFGDWWIWTLFKLFNKDLNFPAFWENEVLLNAMLLIYFFILLKISNILTGCYRKHKRSW